MKKLIALQIILQLVFWASAGYLLSRVLQWAVAFLEANGVVFPT